jgi:hypothetical protein
MRRTQRDTLLIRLLIGAMVVLALNSVLLVVILVRQGGTPVTPLPSEVTAPQPSGQGSTAGAGLATTGLPSAASASSVPSAPVAGATSLETVLLATVAPLKKAAGDFGMDMAQVLPSEAEQQACLDSGSIESEACQLVVTRLEAGYASVNMPFPDLASNMGAAEPVAPSTPVAAPTTPSEGGAGTTPGATADAGQRDILRAFFSVTVERLAQQAKKQGQQAEVSLPSDADIEAAASSGALESEACQALITTLRAQYGIVGLEFPEPVF